MVNEQAQAISVANRYFMLADEMVPGFKNHLAESVMLNWFGQVIRGRENVAAFILSRKKETFHTFSSIMPISDISSSQDASKQSSRKITRSLDRNADCETYMEEHLQNEARSSHETEMSTTRKNVKDSDGYKFDFDRCIDELRRLSIDRDNANVSFNENQIKFSTNAITEVDMSHQCYDLNENDGRSIFEPEITSRPIAGKIQNINRVKLKEEMAPTVGAVNREWCGQGDGSVTAEANATKYLEANGEIKFVRVKTQTDSPFLYHWSQLWRKKVWKRQCKLQLAYSLLIDSPEIATQCCGAQEDACSAHVSNLSTIEIHHDTDKMQKSKLPSLEEAIQVSNALISDVNHFGGYLQPLNFSEDRENFLKTLKNEIARKNPNADFCARYVNNKLVFDFPGKKSFNVLYQIHEIVYSTAKNSASAVQKAAGAK